MIQETISLVWEKLTQISPSIFWASFLFLVGVIISKSMEKLSVAFLNKIRLNKVLERMGLKQAFSRIDVNLDGSKIFGEMVKWFIIILFLMISSGILGLTELSQFLQNVIVYFPNIFIAGLIFVVCAFLADFTQKVVVGTLEKEKITYSRLLGRSIRWIIWFFATLAILYQLKIVPSLILVIFIGMVSAISLALGIAFGLGGKDLSAKILKELEEKFK
ncbi:MAG: mechanosensitive ion channel family protein [Candidatus Nealsonbacteria bacterium]